MRRVCSRSFVFALTAAVAACGGDAADVARTPTPMPTALAGFYAGEFPCSNCLGIEAGLWLREDGAFVFRQRYRSDGGADSVSHGLGRWRWDTGAADLVLEGAGPERRFRRGADATLALQTASPLPHLLAPAAAEPFTASVRIDALAVVADGGATLTECLSALARPLVDGGASTELRRLYARLIARGRPALVGVEARLVAGAGGAESWLVERVLNLRPQETC